MTSPVRLLSLLLAAAWLQACAAGNVVAPQLNAGIGRPLSEWTRQYGEPLNVEKNTDGTRTAHWAWTTTRVAGGYRGPPVPTPAVTPSGKVVTGVTAGEYIPPRLEASACALNATVGADDRVLRWDARGAGCQDILSYPQLRRPAP